MTFYMYKALVKRKHERFINQFHGEVKLNHVYLPILFLLECDIDQWGCDDCR